MLAVYIVAKQNFSIASSLGLERLDQLPSTTSVSCTCQRSIRLVSLSDAAEGHFANRLAAALMMRRRQVLCVGDCPDAAGLKLPGFCSCRLWNAERRV